MSSPPVSQLAFYRDLFFSTLWILFGRLYSKLHPPPANLTGKVVIVTGASSGIGLHVALELVRQNVTVYLACRNASKADEAASHIKSAVPNCVDRVKTLSLDTSSLASVRECAEEWKNVNSKIDILVHNAGIGNNPPGKPFSQDGLPMLYATNFLGSFLLMHLLEQYLSDSARIILTTSSGQYGGDFTPTFSLDTVKNHLEPGFHTPIAAMKPDGTVAESASYSNTKAMQVAFAKLLQRRWDAASKANGVPNKRIAQTFSPGFTMTPIFSKVTPHAFWEDPFYWILCVTTFLATDVSQGAATGVWLAGTDDEAVVGQGKGGGYWERMGRKIARVDLMSMEQLERFWIRWEADAGVVWR